MTENQVGPTVSAQDRPAMVRELGRWIASGASQSPGGAFCAWREGESGDLAFEYPEITGYALTHIAGLPEASAADLDVGRRAATWLLERLDSDWSARAGWDGGAIYNFDLAMISAGLLNFGKLTGEARLCECGHRVAQAIQNDLGEDGLLAPISPAGPRSARTNWSSCGNAHMLKAVQCLLLADQLGSPGELEESASRLVSGTSSLQSDDGFFTTGPEPNLVMLHPHLYSAEGLWMWGVAKKDNEALRRAERAVEWTWQHVLESGGLPGAVDLRSGRASSVEQADVTAQAIRLAKLMRCDVPIDRAADRLCESLLRTTEGAAAVYRPGSGERHECTWATLFSYQALSRLEAGATLEWMYLV